MPDYTTKEDCKDHMKEIHAVLERIETAVTKVEETVNGNGGVGLAEKVRNLEYEEKERKLASKRRAKYLWSAIIVLGIDPIMNLIQNTLSLIRPGG